MEKFIAAILIAFCLIQHVVHTSPVVSSENAFQDTDEIRFYQDSLEETDISEYPTELLDEIKSRILRSLHKSEPPKTHVPLPVLQKFTVKNELSDTEIKSNDIEDRIDFVPVVDTEMISNRTEIKTDFITAVIDNRTSVDDDGLSSVRFHFNLFPKQNFQSAEIWLFKKQNITEFSIAHAISINGTVVEEKATLPVFNQSSSEGWVRFDVSHLVPSESRSTLHFEVSKENREISIDVEDTKPFLLIHTASLKRLSKRSLSDCVNDTSVCCKRLFYLKFSDILWSDWIIQPEGYFANYCDGPCDIGSSNSHHSRVMMALCENNPEKYKQMGKTKCLECVPILMEPISVIYLDEQNVKVVSHLPGMSVTKCGCE